MPWKLPQFGRRHWIIASVISAGAAAIVMLGAIIIYAGAYNIAADSPHTSAVYWLMQTTRNRSIAVRAGDVGQPPDLNDTKRLAAGAGLYSEMCSQCHLAPGMERTEISQGLYPRAPELSRGTDLTAVQEFWVIKHGIKMTGMPSWGVTHNDTLIWDMVAFIRKLPSLDAARYQAIVKSAPADHDEMMRDMPGMAAPDNGDHH